MRKVIAVCLLSILVFASTASAQEKPKFEIENGRLKLTQPITFVTDSDKLTPESDAALSHIKAFLEDKTYITLLRIEGHTDNTGSAAYNQDLSQRRAVSVASVLRESGVPGSRSRNDAPVLPVSKPGLLMIMYYRGVGFRAFGGTQMAIRLR